MARNSRHALVVFLFGVRHAEAFFCAAAAGRFRCAVQPYRPAATPTACFEGRGVGEASPGSQDEQDALPPHFQSVDSVAWVQLLLDSFEETFEGTSLIRGLDRESLSPEEQARQVAAADVAIVSHDFLRSADDPIFIYGNEAGLRTFGYTWDEFTILPSRKSCEEDERAERAELLHNVRELDKSAPAGEYPVVRVTKTGQRFNISAAVWNVKDAGGETVGQAARCTVLD